MASSLYNADLNLPNVQFGGIGQDCPRKQATLFFFGFLILGVFLIVAGGILLDKAFKTKNSKLSGSDYTTLRNLSWTVLSIGIGVTVINIFYLFRGSLLGFFDVHKAPTN